MFRLFRRKQQKLVLGEERLKEVLDDELEIAAFVAAFKASKPQEIDRARFSRITFLSWRALMQATTKNDEGFLKLIGEITWQALSPNNTASSRVRLGDLTSSDFELTKIQMHLLETGQWHERLSPHFATGDFGSAMAEERVKTENQNLIRVAAVKLLFDLRGTKFAALEQEAFNDAAARDKYLNFLGSVLGPIRDQIRGPFPPEMAMLP